LWQITPFFLSFSFSFVFSFYSQSHFILWTNRGHFSGIYSFDLNNTLYFFTAGRREYYNKGVDLFIESLAELNYLLKRDNSEVTVVAFIIIPGQTNNYNVESIKVFVLRNKSFQTLFLSLSFSIVLSRVLTQGIALFHSGSISSSWNSWHMQ
jgi:hypothetical protein